MGHIRISVALKAVCISKQAGECSCGSRGERSPITEQIKNVWPDIAFGHRHTWAVSVCHRIIHPFRKYIDRSSDDYRREFSDVFYPATVVNCRNSFSIYLHEQQFSKWSAGMNALGDTFAAVVKIRARYV